MAKAVQPQQFGPFLLLARLGQGGMGAVYRARDTRNNRYVALKVMNSPGQPGDELVERFRREAAASIELKHPHIVEGYEFNQSSNGMWYFAMELVDGGDLAGRIERESRMPEPETLTIARKIASGLAFAHSKEFVHRDIKPENIMFSAGEPKIADMGLVKPIAGNAAELTAAGVAMGSPHYMAPELIDEAKNATPAVDVYALGCTIYHMLFGQPVFPDKLPVAVLMKHMEESIPNPADSGNCSKPLGLLLNQMTTKRPEDRMPDGSAVVAALDKVLAGQMPPGQAVVHSSIAAPRGVSAGGFKSPGIAAGQQAMGIPGAPAGMKPRTGGGLGTAMIIIAAVLAASLAAFLILQYL